MTVLGIDTSNYATSLAVVNLEANEVVCAKKQFLPVKQGELGLRQSDAVFHHVNQLPKLLEELYLEGALEQKPAAVGVSVRPRPIEGSYMPCFLSGLAVAKAFAVGAGIPLILTSHQQGHIAAAILGTDQPELRKEKSLVFHISGGTTELLLTQEYQVLEKLGESLDLFAGQAVDRLGVRLGYKFPAGEELSRLAEECQEELKPKITLKGMDCCFSGLQNQTEALLQKGYSPSYVAKYCLTAVGDTIAAMIQAARKEMPGLPVICAGGVMASSIIKKRLEASVESIYFVPALYASDNAIGVAMVAGKEASELSQI